MTIDELLCKFQGLEWHQRSDNTQRYRRPSPCTCGKQYTTVLNLKLHLKAANPDFSSDHAGMELYRWFSTSKKDMFTEFEEYMDISTYDFIKFKEVDGKNYMRWVVLLAEWLRLEETKEKWGWEECPNCEQGYAIRKVGDRMEGTTDRCQYCNGTGKIRAEWAREEG